MKLYDISAVREAVLPLLIHHGLPPADAAEITDHLIEAELRGVTTHGLVRLIGYLKRFKCGVLNTRPVIKKATAAGAVALLDGDCGSGQVVGVAAMDEALRLAEKYGVSFVGVRNSSHFGMAAYYAMMGLSKGMIGFVITNASPRMVPTGGREKMIGNNPFAIAFPVDAGYPIVVDMALSVAAAGKIRNASAKNEPIPADWALDEDGLPTQDPAKALRGFLLPIGGHKGYALAVAFDLLAGVLTGAAFGPDIGSLDDLTRHQNVGHVFGAVKIDKFMPEEEYQARIARYVQQIKSTKKSPGCKEIFLPGEQEARRSERYRREGIPLDDKLVREINDAGMKYNVATTL